ncbi:MAG: flagellar hook-basal body complex protein, partial [Candidatus Hydrogenedentes bacterium]|nr:flagellar hook-basal body complex protein [Candidatus Hydrogenedentota bacterium]
MGTAIFAGISGLQNQQRALDVIGNNIANVNTTGYRGGRVLFQDLFSATVQGASGPSGGRSGTNPSQVGLGVGLANIDINFNQGSFQTTNVASDLGIQGDGFFVLSNGSSLSYTRDGSFGVDPEGYLVDPATGYRVQGYPAVDGVVDTTGGIGNISIQIGGAALARATSAMTFTGNLDSEAVVGDPPVTRTVAAYDSLGQPVNMTFTFTRTAAPTNNYRLVVTTDRGTPGGDAAGFDVTFDNDGQILASSAAPNIT